VSIEPTREDYLAEAAKLDPRDRVRFMTKWFFEHYEDPVHSLPYDDGEYVWLVDECDADEEIRDMFGGAVDEALIRTAVGEVEQEGWQWVRIADLDAMDEDNPEPDEFEDVWDDDLRSDPLVYGVTSPEMWSPYGSSCSRTSQTPGNRLDVDFGA